MSEPTPSVSSLLVRVVPWMRADWPFYAAAFLAAPVSTLLIVVQPWLLKIAIDDHILKDDVSGVIQVAWLYLFAVLIGFVFEAAYTLALSYGAMRTISRMRRDVYRHTLGLARSYFDHQPTGRLLTRATSDIEALGETLTAGAITIVLDVLLVLGILAAMFALDARLTGMLLLFSPVLAFVVDGIRRVLRRLYQTVRTALSALNAYLAERITGIRVVQLYRDEARTLAAFDSRLSIYRNATIRTNIWDAFLYAIIDGLSSICTALLLLYGSGWLFGGDLVTVGLLTAFIQYVNRLFQPIREFSQKLAVIQRAAAALEKIFGILDVEETIATGTVDLSEPAERIVMKNVSFSYGDGPTVLSNVSLTIEAGQTVALVGRTGSGKTTVGKLLTRAYQGYTGSITINGVEISDLTESSLRGALRVVQQDVQMFPGSVRFNVSLGADIDDRDLEEAIALCRAGEAVARLGGLDGSVTHHGANVSVGEAQLFSFARTLAADTPIVILDEATASVDSMTELAIQQATDALLARRTVLVIAHRLSTIVNADEIIVLDAGEVIERGTHESLLEARGAYAALFDSQFHKGDAAAPAHA